ncbi:hypothetical protein G7Y89_g3003 [Cudoniella acicularis]|uniref:Heterokaryon incompatibility domain-containing protein n=1 Tax=Cudoniella acicularis TaxID=354080 RepID=A0A8H4W5L4_9HELO|nr:hypothetical protein G7Y89_g3003 [Cudoniella acicularis]
MPTRLLDLMPTESGIELRLILSSHITAKYVALSRCWGNCQIAKTTSENIHSMFHNIPLSSLPQTFQDTVNLCREFKIRYLWIDSLCIVQDDIMEWRHEAGRMTSVYGNAFLVIAASASSDDNIGMFPRREGHYYHQSDFEWNGHAITVKAQPWRQHYEHYFSGEGPLATRSWGYQERLLGQRVLSYHQDELFSECNEMWRCECGVGDRIGNSKHPYNLREIFDNGKNHLDALYREWRQTIVCRYACRDLSKASDKLPAISRVTEAFRSRLDDDYVAGLCRMAERGL